MKWEFTRTCTKDWLRKLSGRVVLKDFEKEGATGLAN